MLSIWGLWSGEASCYSLPRYVLAAVRTPAKFHPDTKSVQCNSVCKSKFPVTFTVGKQLPASVALVLASKNDDSFFSAIRNIF